MLHASTSSVGTGQWSTSRPSRFATNEGILATCRWAVEGGLKQVWTL